MRKYALFFLVVVLFVSACEDKLLKPSEFSPKSPAKASFANKNRLIDEDGNFYPGYRNFDIRADRVTLSWEKCTDADFELYQLYKSNVPVVTLWDVNQVSFTDSLLNSDTEYRYTVVCRLKNGISKTDSFTIKTPKIEAPTIRHRINHQDQVVLNWTDNSEIPGKFVLYRDNEEIKESAGVWPPNPGYVHHYVDEDATPGSTHYYDLVKIGEYDDSDPNIYPCTVNYTMNAPYLQSLEQLYETPSIKLHWVDNSSGETAFRIYRKSDQEDNYRLIHTTNTYDVEEYTDNSSDLQYDTTYWYYVTAVDAERSPFYESLPSNIRYKTILENPTVMWKIALKDSYGDGWGGTLDLNVNGVPILWDWFLPGGFGPSYHSFEVSDGDLIEIEYHSGAWAYEEYYAIIDHHGDIVAESGGTWDNPDQSAPTNMQITVDLHD